MGSKGAIGAEGAEDDEGAEGAEGAAKCLSGVEWMDGWIPLRLLRLLEHLRC